MERKIILITTLSLIALLALVAMFMGKYGYVTVSLFGYPILYYTQRDVFSRIQWIVLIVTLLLITVTSVNLLANLTGHLLFYYEFFGSLLVLLLTLAWTPDKETMNENKR